MRGIGAGQLCLISEVGEGVENLTTTAELASAIHADKLIGTGWRVTSWPLIEPIDGRGVGGEGATNQTTTEVVGDEDVAGFAVMSHSIVETFGIRALLDHESKINAKALQACGGGHGVCMSTRRFAEL